MVERIAQHRHCKECDKAIPYKDKYCDETCEAAWKKKMGTKKRQLTYFYLAMVAILVMAIVLGLVGSR
jgi:predicted nucleic acid-binding Zn ribbon protein